MNETYVYLRYFTDIYGRPEQLIAIHRDNPITENSELWVYSKENSGSYFYTGERWLLNTLPSDDGEVIEKWRVK